MEAERAGPHPVDQQPRRGRLEPEAEALGLGDERPRHVPRPRLLELVELASGGLDGLGELRRRLRAGDKDDGEVGREIGEGGRDRVELAIAPALDAVGQQVAA